MQWLRPVGAGLAAAAAAAALAGAPSTSLRLDPAASRITVVARQMGVPIEGEFRQITARLDFDPADPAGGQASFTIEVASFDLGDQEFNRELQKPEWFDAARHPHATFTTTRIEPDGPGRLLATGRLTIKGRSADLDVPVEHRQEDGRQVFEGRLPLPRLQFDIGSGAWRDTAVVADQVEIRFRISAAGP